MLFIFDDYMNAAKRTQTWHKTLINYAEACFPAKIFLYDFNMLFLLNKQLGVRLSTRLSLQLENENYQQKQLFQSIFTKK